MLPLCGSPIGVAKLHATFEPMPTILSTFPSGLGLVAPVARTLAVGVLIQVFRVELSPVFRGSAATSRPAEAAMDVGGRR
jgi:hypothetical protein